jgi:murein DD-endopeptidase MepM/ murein hydrolase activator NlpD
VTVLLNASVGVQRVLARLRPVQSRRFAAADLLRQQRVFVVALMTQLAAHVVRLPAATLALLRPATSARRPAAGTVARHSTVGARRSGLTARSLSADSERPARPATSGLPAPRHLHRPALAARSAPAAHPLTAGRSQLARRSLISMIGAERAVPAAAIAIVLLATALSSTPSLGNSGPVGGPTGNGPDARISLGGVASAIGAPQGDAGTGTGQQAGTDPQGGTDGTIDQSGPDGGLGRAAGGPTTTDNQAIADAFVDDGTLLKPVAVDTSVSDGKGLMRSYRVRSGDTLTGIARKFGVSMMTVWWANHLTHKDDLHIGQTLTIPPVSGVVVTVGSSDTLDSVAARYGVDAATIVDANALADPNLIIGQTLTIPGALGDEIATPKPTRPPSRSGGSGGSGHSGGSGRPVSPPSHYSGGNLSWPVAGGYISQYFHYGHYAIDIAADRGTPVKAAASGVVTFAGWKSNGGGYQVWISHGSGLYTTYNHMSAVSVGRGQHVGRGQIVGRVGMTGNATGPHLHFEVWRGDVWGGGTRVNPLLYL